MTINKIIGNKEKTSRIDTELWKKLNEKYSRIETKTKEEPHPIETPIQNINPEDITKLKEYYEMIIEVEHVKNNYSKHT